MHQGPNKIKSSLSSFGKTTLAVLFCAQLLSGCSADRRLASTLKKTFKRSPVLRQYQAGFALYDPENDRMIFEKDAEKYFIPASNTKLFTFYAGLKILPERVPALRYVVRNDSLIFWGTGDPSFLQSRLKGKKAFDFLKQSQLQLFYAPGRYTGQVYGKGWAWDDYNDYYQAEINDFPIQDNLVSLSEKSSLLQVSPGFFRDCLFKDADTAGPFRVVRDFNTNAFHYHDRPVPQGYHEQVPYKLSLATTLSLLADTLGRGVSLLELKMPADAQTIEDVPRDSLLREMMLPSDNFIAEQLILLYANQTGIEMNTDTTINYILKTYLSDLPDRPSWVDGSGLSRMNLFTPRDITFLLNKIYKTVNNPERLYAMLPAGGKTGTLKNAYPATEKPFVFGKTGSFSNNHNQSGYVLTKKGKTYLFSFMNNSYTLPTAAVRQEMVRIITEIHEKF
ncbi:Peptidase S13, D-Ala-D-Ala carboxypeptidase C [Pedobacter sp. BAL39]|uniref:D-alanyl-D-alanine carboxypeptidase/D-alanyl-D-alanine-endopeptidase n=1 Tax=Pedobacter sp. BAL39 TaxID=391596 RepID=UPI0001559A18|nr:D-alanyl-D-alanine carboxypeptidase [Pedobacter sp. BAL39]EDM36348.1 Peptidase S13, D-Ala-D-Ala carboxypeptidase C [Pedobacter sp. BAL39]